MEASSPRWRAHNSLKGAEAEFLSMNTSARGPSKVLLALQVGMPEAANL